MALGDGQVMVRAEYMSNVPVLAVRLAHGARLLTDLLQARRSIQRCNLYRAYRKAATLVHVPVAVLVGRGRVVPVPFGDMPGGVYMDLYKN